MKPITKLASLLLGVVSILHLLRVIFKIDVIIDNVNMPIWISIIGFIIPAILCIGLWKEASIKQ